ncbi:protein shisa-5-like [Oryzias latipes]|uniref:protein shisa-5-like n=1 Tax=Oryzias latipes TaxID=8090 RepID=UPI0002A4A846|nr:protein shisa-5-like [Oryzias latipes]
MVPGVSGRTLCVFCVVLLRTVWGDLCISYRDMDGNFHEARQCSKYCCGDCSFKNCCNDKKLRFTQEKQEQCFESSVSTAVLVGIIVGTLIPVILAVTLLICCLAPCCLCYRKCRKGHSPRSYGSAVNASQPAQPQSANQPSNAGYQPVSAFEGPPMPTAPPPSYIDSTDPVTVDFTHGLPMYHINSTGEPETPPPSYTEELAQPPYNPSFLPSMT